MPGSRRGSWTRASGRSRSRACARSRSCAWWCRRTASTRRALCWASRRSFPRTRRKVTRSNEGGATLAGGRRMISFELSEEHQAVEQAVRDWAGREVAPKIHDLDREHRFERGFLKGMADLHLLGICIPEEWGGAGMDYLSLGVVCEELEYVDTHLRVIMSVHVGLNCMTLWCWGSDDQNEK